MPYTTSSDDKDLIRAVQDGDETAFAILVQRYEKTVYHTAFLVTGNAEDAADLSQDIFLRLWNGLKNFRGEAKFFTWLVSVAKNTSADWIRKKKRRIRTVSLTQDEDEDTPPAFAEPEDPDPDVNPALAAEKRERQEAVRAAVASLGEEHRIVIQLRDMEGMSYEDIADRLGISIGTVKSRISRARVQVRKILENGNFFDEMSD